MRRAAAIIGLLIAASSSAAPQDFDTLWTIRGGTYAGESVSIVPSAATRKGSTFWRLSNIRGEQRVVGWNPSRLPVAVAFRGESRISQADSTVFWTILRQMESDVGLQLFEPLALDRDSDPEDVIIVSLKPMASTDGLTLVTWSSHGSLYDPRVYFQSRATLRDDRIVTHEMMHALGFGHTSAWTSVMNPARHNPSRLTSTDVAYVQSALASRVQYERTDMWSRIALAVSREPAAPLENGSCELFSPPVRFPEECMSFPCSLPSASCAAGRSTAPSPAR